MSMFVCFRSRTIEIHFMALQLGPPTVTHSARLESNLGCCSLWPPEPPIHLTVGAASRSRGGQNWEKLGDAAQTDRPKAREAPGRSSYHAGQENRLYDDAQNKQKQAYKSASGETILASDPKSSATHAHKKKQCNKSKTQSSV